MFCEHCGNRLPEDAKFCTQCGHVIQPEKMAAPTPESPPPQPAAEPAPQQAAPQQPVAPQPAPPASKGKKKPVVPILVAAVAVVCAAIFGLRTINEKKLLDRVVEEIEGVQEKEIVAFYDEKLPMSWAEKGYEIRVEKENFTLEKTSDGNKFYVKGTIEVEDHAQGGDATVYETRVEGTLHTDLLRMKCETKVKLSHPEINVTLPAGGEMTPGNGPSQLDTEIWDYSIYNHTYGNSANMDKFYTNGGVMVELKTKGQKLSYKVSRVEDYTLRYAGVEGLVKMDGKPEIHFYKEDDGWGNAISGTIYLLPGGEVAVQSDIVSGSGSLWGLGIPYTELHVLDDVSGGEAAAGDGYLYPSNSQYITRQELEQHTREEIVLIRNEIYARYGYNFQDENIRSWFEAQDWYFPIEGVNADSFDSAVFNNYERENLTTILEYEREMGWRS